METLKYTIIKSDTQYREYLNTLEGLLGKKDSSRNYRDEIELLTLLIEKWEIQHFTLKEADPVRLLQSLMQDHKLKANDLVGILGVSKGLISDILNYKKGLSKNVIRTLSRHFNVSQEAFNRPYKLKKTVNSELTGIVERISL
jgi:HTH-type transcriptional regulator / antitoxin HigA